MPSELVVRFAFSPPGADAWLRVGSVDLRYITDLPRCGAGKLGELP